jgi:putative membrane protein
MKRMTWLSVVAAAAIAVGCERTDRVETTTPAVGTSGVETVSSSDRDFVRDLTIANTAEVELGRLANEHAASPAVKKFGQMMIDDHSKAGEKLKAITTQHNITASALLDDKHRDLKETLAKLNGADFDRKYIDTMIDGHQDVLDKLESRIDKDTLAAWKAQVKDTVGKATPQDKAQAAAVTPERSDNPITMAINGWAAEAYPTVSAHLDAAKTVKEQLDKRRPTN